LAQECEETATILVRIIIHPLDACYDSFCGWMNSLQLTEVILGFILNLSNLTHRPTYLPTYLHNLFLWIHPLK
jgi:hypothetical protein